jgi:hypothetical protein
MEKKKETRGRKPVKDKKQTVCLYVETSKVNNAGGMDELKDKLYKHIDSEYLGK